MVQLRLSVSEVVVTNKHADGSGRRLEAYRRRLIMSHDLQTKNEEDVLSIHADMRDAVTSSV